MLFCKLLVGVLQGHWQLLAVGHRLNCGAPGRAVSYAVSV